MRKMLADIVDIRGRVGWKGYTVNDLRNEGPWVIGAHDITSSHKLTLKNAKHISREKFEESPEIKIEKNDILIVKVGSTIGKVAIVNYEIGEACINPNTVLLKNCKEIPQYLYYYLTSDLGQKYLINNSSASAQSALNQTDLKKLPINFPPRIVQEKIAGILSALDDKIELNNQINAELEAMAKTLYNYWFVQFDFPDEIGKPYKSSGGKMVYHEVLKREIPEGWEVKKLSECIEKIIDYRGRTPKKLESDWSEKKDDIIALSAKHVKGGKLVNLEAANRVDGNLYSKWMKEELKEGDILMTSEAPCGEFFYIIGDTKYCLSQRLFAMRANSEIIHHSCLYFELSAGNGYSQIMGKVSGSTVFGIRQDELRTVNVLVPAKELQQSFEEKVIPIYQKIRINEKQNQELAQLRDWLLPMLMNGQVTVGEVEEKMSMVAEEQVGYQKS